jgi:hypothetical protein
MEQLLSDGKVILIAGIMEGDQDLVGQAPAATRLSFTSRDSRQDQSGSCG